MEYKFPSDYWRLCDDVTLVQASLLILDIEPEGIQERVLGDVTFGEPIKPQGFDAVIAALNSAIETGRLKSNAVRVKKRVPTEDNEGAPAWMEIETDNLNPKETTIAVVNLKHWLIAKGMKGKFFFPDGAEHQAAYLDPTHPCYAPKLAAAVKAWITLSQDKLLAKGRSPKKVIRQWLEQNAASLGLVKEDGTLNNEGIGEVAKVVNWQWKGGAPKSN